MSIEKTLELDEKRTQGDWYVMYPEFEMDDNDLDIATYEEGGPLMMCRFDDKTRVHDAEFIANAPKAVEQLRGALAENERLRIKNYELGGEIELEKEENLVLSKLQEMTDETCAELEAERDKYKKALEDIHAITVAEPDGAICVKSIARKALGEKE